MNARMTPPMRRLLLTALLVAGACAEQRAPIPITYEPQAAAPAAAGTPGERAARRLDRAMAQETRQDRARDADPYAASMTGAPTPASDLEIGGGNPGQPAPQIGVPFR